jgi:uncharacterized NAD-dependent epimerase/dehydratase family protein
MDTAAVLCEGAFGKNLGKTAAGLVRHSLRFKIVGVIDSTVPYGDAGEYLDGVKKGIPIFHSLQEMIKSQESLPKFLIIGVATIGGKLPDSFRAPVREALSAGINVISGLHEQIHTEPEFVAAAEAGGSVIVDIRKERKFDDLHYFKNLAKDLPCVRIPVLGTDAAIGKRTAAIILTDTLNSLGIKTTFIATGQTGLLQGSQFGIPVDAIRSDFVVGELEAEIIRAYEHEKPKVMLVEGQGALSHPAYVTGSRAIVSASSPSGVILQHSPRREFRTFHEAELHLPMPTIDSEIELIRVFAKAPLVAITLNHYNMTKEEVQETEKAYEARYGIPCADVLASGAEKVAKSIIVRYGL